MLGTPYLPDFCGALLLLEDVTERPYRLDRLLTQLSLAGVLGQVAGVAVGTLTGCEEKDADYTALDVVLEILRAHGMPSAAGFPIGHGDENLPVVLGGRYTLDASKRTLTPVAAP
jgi:muramoyltetrapeptide carboxypeptidase